MDRRQFGFGLLAALGARGAAAAEIEVAGSPLATARGRRVAVYQWTPAVPPAGVGPLFARAGYLHPVFAPNGAVVTDDFPPDHRHQRGVFFAWTRTRIGSAEPDFWNLGAGTGRIRADSFERTADGLRALHTWEMREGAGWTPVLAESWRITVLRPAFTDPRAPDAANVFDLVSRQRPSVRIELPQYRYGGMAVRGAREWHTRPREYAVLTSEGKDRRGADASTARWVDQSGPIGGLTAGIALLEHPENLGAPNQLRVPPDHPYAVFSPPKSEARVLEAGKEYVFRYRLVAHNGPAVAKALDAEWERFAAR